MRVRPTLALPFLLSLALAGCGGGPPAIETRPAAGGNVDMREARVVEAACGQCQFGLPGDGCDLAVRIAGTAYFVEGTGIDDHGDAHAADGFCNAVRRARVDGEVVEGRFVARSFELVPD